MKLTKACFVLSLCLLAGVGAAQDPVSMGVSWSYSNGAGVPTHTPSQYVTLYASRFEGALPREVKTLSLLVSCSDRSLVEYRMPDGTTSNWGMLGPGASSYCGSDVDNGLPSWTIVTRYNGGYPLRPRGLPYYDIETLPQEMSADWDNTMVPGGAHAMVVLRFDGVPNQFQVAANGPFSGLYEQRWPDINRRVHFWYSGSGTAIDVMVDNTNGLKLLNQTGPVTPIVNMSYVVLSQVHPTHPQITLGAARYGVLFNNGQEIVFDQCGSNGATVRSNVNWYARTDSSPFHHNEPLIDPDPPLTGFGSQVPASKVVGLPIVAGEVSSDYIFLF